MGVHRIGLVGESNYQPAIGPLRAGEPVRLVAEPNNPYDPRAVRCEEIGGKTIGYLERGSWLTDQLLDDGILAASRILAVIGGTNDKPMRGVVLEVFTGKDAEIAMRTPPPLPTDVPFEQAPPLPSPPSQYRDWLLVFGVIVGALILLGWLNQP